jgi:hypothetical protein
VLVVQRLQIQLILIRTTTINFEADQQDAMKKTEGVQSLADQVGRLEIVFSEIDEAESRLKLLKKKKRPHIR